MKIFITIVVALFFTFSALLVAMKSSTKTQYHNTKHVAKYLQRPNASYSELVTSAQLLDKTLKDDNKHAIIRALNVSRRLQCSFGLKDLKETQSNLLLNYLSLEQAVTLLELINKKQMFDPKIHCPLPELLKKSLSTSIVNDLCRQFNTIQDYQAFPQEELSKKMPLNRVFISRLSALSIQNISFLLNAVFYLNIQKTLEGQIIVENCFKSICKRLENSESILKIKRKIALDIHNNLHPLLHSLFHKYLNLANIINNHFSLTFEVTNYETIHKNWLNHYEKKQRKRTPKKNEIYSNILFFVNNEVVPEASMRRTSILTNSRKKIAFLNDDENCIEIQDINKKLLHSLKDTGSTYSSQLKKVLWSDDGKWLAAISEINQGKVDFTYAPTNITYLRLRYIRVWELSSDNLSNLCATIPIKVLGSLLHFLIEEGKIDNTLTDKKIRNLLKDLPQEIKDLFISDSC